MKNEYSLRIKKVSNGYVVNLYESGNKLSETECVESIHTNLVDAIRLLDAKVDELAGEFERQDEEALEERRRNNNVVMFKR